MEPHEGGNASTGDNKMNVFIFNGVSGNWRS